MTTRVVRLEIEAQKCYVFYGCLPFLNKLQNTFILTPCVLKDHLHNAVITTGIVWKTNFLRQIVNTAFSIENSLIYLILCVVGFLECVYKQAHVYVYYYI